ncbi:TRAP transporter small permease [Terrarubrum flagellatum]|uniref:TRAP transporter small permease n=1 Tax=Terrirubrum flagellatum TaxID=2895980 RepID=UPI003145666B
MAGEAGAGAQRSGFGRFLDALYLGAGWLAGAFLVLIFLLMIALSAGRQIGVNVPAGDDFTAWAMAAMAFLGLAHTFKSGDMIRVGLLLERLHGRTKRAFELLSLGVALVFILYFGRYMIEMVYDSWRFNDMAQGVVAMPLWIPQSGLAIGLVILAIAIIDEIVYVARGNNPSFDKEPPASPEELVARVAEGGGV